MVPMSWPLIFSLPTIAAISEFVAMEAKDVKLKNTLIENCYLNTKARPVLHQNESVPVEISLIALRFHGIDELEQQLTFSVVINLKWQHCCARWADNTEFYELRHLPDAFKAVDNWYPSVLVTSSKDALILQWELEDKLSIRIRRDGTVHLQIPATLSTSCELE